MPLARATNVFDPRWVDQDAPPLIAEQPWEGGSVFRWRKGLPLRDPGLRYRSFMSRIIGGAGKGRRLKTAAGHDTRPTGARVRRSLFDILAPIVRGCRFLDVFAGNGSVGLEALSRGAARVVLVDRDAAAVEAAQENARALARSGGQVRVFRQDARTAIPALADEGLRFDVVYLDPPYASELYEPLLLLVGEGPLLAPGGVVVAEHFHKRALPERIGALVLARRTRVGDHVLSFYARADEAEGGTEAG